MLHEILFALMGHTGDVIVFQDDKFIVNPALRNMNTNQVNEHQILSAAEAELINKIVSLGAQYKLIKEFLDRYSGLSTSLALQLAYGGNDNARKGERANDSDIEPQDGD